MGTKRGRGRWDESETGVGAYTLSVLRIKQATNEHLLYSTGTLLRIKQATNEHLLHSAGTLLRASW